MLVNLLSYMYLMCYAATTQPVGLVHCHKDGALIHRDKHPGLNFLDIDMRAGEGKRRADFANVHRRIRLAWHCVGTKHEYLIRFKQGKQYVRS